MLSDSDGLVSPTPIGLPPLKGLCPEEAHAVQCIHPGVTPVLQADFQGTSWHLCTTSWVIASLAHTTRERLVCFFKTHKQSYIHTLFTKHLPTAHSGCTQVAIHFIRTHLLQKDLSSWAACMQARLRFMNFREHKTMCMARGVSRVHEWQICVPPPVEYICIVLHCHMLFVYIGRTTAALI